MAVPKRPPPEASASQRREWAKLMNLSVIGMVFPVSMVLGFLAGRYIGGFFEAERLGGMIGGLVGIVSAFYNMIKMVSQIKPSGTTETDDDGPRDTP